MAALNTATHKAVVTATGNVKDASPVDMRVMLARLLGDMGIAQIAAGNTQPANRDALWWHIDVKQLKRFDAVQGNWFPLAANQLAMHFFRRSVMGSVTDTSLESGDLFLFWDASLGDAKVITRDSLMNAVGAVRTIATTEGIQGGGTLAANRELKLDVNGLVAKPVLSPADSIPLFSAEHNAHRKTTIDAITKILISNRVGFSYFMAGH